jgi:hypothetical protein
MPVEDKMGETGDQTAEDIKHEIPDFPHAVLDIITKDEQYPHVGDNMTPAAMQEHVGKKRPYQRNPNFIHGCQSSEPYLVRDQPVLVNYSFRLLLVEKKNGVKKYAQVRKDNEPVNDRKTF